MTTLGIKVMYANLYTSGLTFSLQIKDHTLTLWGNNLPYTFLKCLEFVRKKKNHESEKNVKYMNNSFIVSLYSVTG